MHVVHRAQQFNAATSLQAFGEVDPLVLQEAGKLQGGNRPEPRVLQFCEISLDPLLYSSNGGGVDTSAWTVSDLIEASN